MTLWWIGNAIFSLVVIPAVVLCLHQVLKPAKTIQVYAEDITDHGSQFGPHLEALQDLVRTRELVGRVNADLERYIRALDRMPSGERSV